MVSPAESHDQVLTRLEEVFGLTDNQVYLIIAWLVNALDPSGPHVILQIRGGNPKVLARFLKRLIDPSTTLLRRTPKEAM